MGMRYTKKDNTPTPAEERAYRNRMAANAILAKRKVEDTLSRIRKNNKTPVWLLEEMEEILKCLEDLPEGLIKYRDLIPK